jgi:hypothetical protein
MFGLTAHDARADDSHMLHFACENGHLGVAQWLWNTFGLAAADVCAGAVDYRACLKRRGRCAYPDATVAWLREAFPIAT